MQDEKSYFEAHISHFTKAIEIDPSYALAYSNRGSAYGIGKGQYDKAISDYNKAGFSPKK